MTERNPTPIVPLAAAAREGPGSATNSPTPVPMPPLRFEFTYAAEELRDLRTYRFPRRGLAAMPPEHVAYRLLSHLLPAVVALYFTAMGIALWVQGEGGIAGPALAFAAPTAYVLLFASYRGARLRAYRFTPMPAAGVRCAVEVSADGFAVTIDGWLDNWPWWSVDGWGDTRTMLVVRRTDGVRVAIPFRALGADGLPRLMAVLYAGTPSVAATGTKRGFPVLPGPAGPRH